MMYEVTERLENELSNPSVALLTSQLILQPFRHFTYVTTHSPALPSLYLHHSSFFNPSDASPTSQLILQSFFRFSCITGSSLTSTGEPPMHLISVFFSHLRQSLFEKILDAIPNQNSTYSTRT